MNEKKSFKKTIAIYVSGVRGKMSVKSLLIWTCLLVFFYLVGMIMPEGLDWKNDFSQGRVYPIWTPWTVPLLSIINWPLVVSITCVSIIYRTYQYNKSPVPTVLALLSLPTLWVFALGNLDGLVLAGLLFLPWGIPLAAMKPQIAAFALLAKKSSIIAGITFFIITLFIWGFWPVNFLGALTPEFKTEFNMDIDLFPWGILIALPLLWISRGDEDLLMAAGSFMTPHLFPYHFILLMPSLGRMKTGWMLIVWLLSWTPLISSWVGPIGYRMGNVFALILWMGIYFSKRKPEAIDHEPILADLPPDRTQMTHTSGIRQKNP